MLPPQLNLHSYLFFEAAIELMAYGMINAFLPCEAEGTGTRFIMTENYEGEAEVYIKVGDWVCGYKDQDPWQLSSFIFQNSDAPGQHDIIPSRIEVRLFWDMAGAPPRDWGLQERLKSYTYFLDYENLRIFCEIMDTYDTILDSYNGKDLLSAH